MTGLTIIEVDCRHIGCNDQTFDIQVTRQQSAAEILINHGVDILQVVPIKTSGDWYAAANGEDLLRSSLQYVKV